MSRLPCHDCGVNINFTGGIGHYYSAQQDVWNGGRPAA
jgi:hypothetical protein